MPDRKEAHWVLQCQVCYSDIEPDPNSDYTVGTCTGYGCKTVYQKQPGYNYGTWFEKPPACPDCEGDGNHRSSDGAVFFIVGKGFKDCETCDGSGLKNPPDSADT